MDTYHGVPLSQIATNRHVTIYPDEAGFRHQAHTINQRVGSGAFITAIDEEGEWDPASQAIAFQSVAGQQTVPRAELNTPAHLLPQLTDALSILTVTDNEPFYLNASDVSRLTKALRGDNADLWQQWANAVTAYPTGIAIAHIRSHALDDDSEKSKALLAQNVRRPRYSTPALRNEEQRTMDNAACRFRQAHHNGLLHSVGNAIGDKAAAVAQLRSLPSNKIAAEYEKHTDVRTQGKLAEVPPAPDFSTTFADAANALEGTGHAIYMQGKWLRCRNCPTKSCTDAFRTFRSKPCIPMPTLHHHVTSNADDSPPQLQEVNAAISTEGTEPPPDHNTPMPTSHVGSVKPPPGSTSTRSNATSATAPWP